jgi:hypothetical protein
MASRTKLLLLEHVSWSSQRYLLSAFFSNVFVALERGFLLVDTLFGGGCGGRLGGQRFVVARREVDSGSVC